MIGLILVERHVSGMTGLMLAERHISGTIDMKMAESHILGTIGLMLAERHVSGTIDMKMTESHASGMIGWMMAERHISGMTRLMLLKSVHREHPSVCHTWPARTQSRATSVSGLSHSGIPSPEDARSRKDLEAPPPEQWCYGSKCIAEEAPDAGGKDAPVADPENAQPEMKVMHEEALGKRPAGSLAPDPTATG
ncbi:hypothetical protein B296_00010841 [Ensete ventricosum]|uniref:Uncharacterized protein n=1 Tax=Ensete ventricosum TaxID=4639 RepID=A0A427ATN2_ENSVE|nr:hypothetical protein B296_00010841 [Ensete ventricosum]